MKGLGVARIARDGVGGAVVQTAINNMAMTAVSMVAGVLLARDLGPSERGEYAAVTVWWAFALILGEIGLTAATTYFVARSEDRSRDYVATARVIMTASGAIVAMVGWFIAPTLGSHDSDLVFSYRLMFLVCVPAFAGAGYIFGLQASNISRWNLTRAVQPTSYLIAIAALDLLDALTLRSACVTLAGTVIAQAFLGYALCRKGGLAGGTFDLALVKPLIRYGLSQLLSSASTVVNGRLDQLVLSQTVRSSLLGYYAVAVTLSSLVIPAVSAIGSVAFPRLAASRSHGADEQRFQNRALLIATQLGVASGLVIAGTTPWVVPLLFGEAYEPAVQLVWLLVPGGVFLAVGQVAGDLLRGRGEPLAVAWAQGVAAVVTVGLLLWLLPVYGVEGAAVASTVAYAVALALMLIALRRTAGTPKDPAVA